MSQQGKGGLGRGLSALLPKVAVNSQQLEATADEDVPAAPVEAPEAVTASPSRSSIVRELEIGSIKPNPRQPRKNFEDAELEGLAASIRAIGVLQPIIVRAKADGTMELVAGERRLRASLRAGRSTIPAVVRTDDDDFSLLAAFVENVQRVDLDPLEEAAGYRTLIDDLGVTHEDVAVKVGKSRATVTNALRLLTLAPEVQRRVADRELSAAHARTIAALANPDQQIAAAKQVIQGGLSVRATEALVKELAEKQPLTEHAVRTRAGRSSKRADKPAGVLEAERLLSDALDTSVRIEHSASGRGRISIDYAGTTDLARIVDSIGRR